MREAYLFRPLPIKGAFYLYEELWYSTPGSPECKNKINSNQLKSKGNFFCKGKVAVLLSCLSGLSFSPVPPAYPSLLSLRPLFSLPVIPGSFFSLSFRAWPGIQVSKESILTWTPARGRSDSKKMRPEWQIYWSHPAFFCEKYPGICEFPPFLNHQYSLSHIMIKKRADPLTFFLPKKRGVTVIG